MGHVSSLTELVRRAGKGDLDAYAQLVEATQKMAYAVAFGVVRDRGLAEDAAQEAYLRAFKRLKDLDEPAAFAGWLRRIVITAALNIRRSRRLTLLQLDDAPDVPVLDEQETTWSDQQRQRLSAALLTLTNEERRLCDRRYHGRWSAARLAQEAGTDEATMRKRLQRVRDKLRKEMEVTEQRGVRSGDLRPDFPAKVVELLARPKLTDLPENPVGRTRDLIRPVYAEFADHELPEIVDFAEARKTIGDEALYLSPGEIHRVDSTRILRYDLTLPLLLSARYTGTPLRVWASGKVYRLCQTDATHLEAFHQADVLCVDEQARINPWQMTARVLESVHVLLPGRALKIVPTQYPMCTEAWELEVEDEGQWYEVLAWGVFNRQIVSHLGADPAVHTAIGVGYGLERLAMLRYGIDDARKIDVASVA